MSKKSKRAGRMDRAHRGNSNDAGVSIVQLEEILADHGLSAVTYFLLFLGIAGFCIYLSAVPIANHIFEYGSLGIVIIVSALCASIVLGFKHRSAVLSDVVFEKEVTLRYRYNTDARAFLGVSLVLAWRRLSRRTSLLLVCTFAALPFVAVTFPIFMVLKSVI